jgi:hypothetical protein
MAERALTWSYGGGVQSIAIAVLVARGRLPRPECIVMADTGREASETWEYHAAYTAPLLASVGLAVEVAAHDLATRDLYATDGKTILPMFSTEGALRAFCSGEWKREVVKRYLRAKGYGPARPVTSWLGISLDEVERLKRSRADWQRLHWPLCFDVPMTRAECRALILAAGLPEPPKSSCWMCPYRQNAQWRRLKEHYPGDWAQAVALDAEVRSRDPEGALYLHHSRVPLADADLGEDAAAVDLPLFSAGCQTGYCWT